MRRAWRDRGIQQDINARLTPCSQPLPTLGVVSASWWSRVASRASPSCEDFIFPTKTGRPRRFGAAVPLFAASPFRQEAAEAVGAARGLRGEVVGAEATGGRCGAAGTIGGVRRARVSGHRDPP